MATMADAVYQGRRPLKTRTTAVLSALGVISGAFLVFRVLAPRPRTLNTKEEVAAFQGNSRQTDQGDHTARAPGKR